MNKLGMSVLVMAMLASGTALAQQVVMPDGTVVEGAPLTPPSTPADTGIVYPKTADPMPDVPAAALPPMDPAMMAAASTTIDPAMVAAASGATAVPDPMAIGAATTAPATPVTMP